MKYREFVNEYNHAAREMVLKAIKCGEVYRTCDHELEPGRFLARAWKDGDSVRYEEYWNITDKKDLTANSVPDLSLDVEFERGEGK